MGERKWKESRDWMRMERRGWAHWGDDGWRDEEWEDEEWEEMRNGEMRSGRR